MNRNELLDNYEFLINDIINAKRLKRGKLLTAGMYVKGEQYQLDNEKRLLIVGRALNGWEANDIVWETGDANISAFEKATQILNHWSNQETAPDWGGNTDRFYDRALTKSVSSAECIAL